MGIFFCFLCGFFEGFGKFFCKLFCDVLYILIKIVGNELCEIGVYCIYRWCDGYIVIV